MITFFCQGCGKKLGAHDEKAGKNVKCPGCGRPAPVPATSALPPPPQPGAVRKANYDFSAVPDAVPNDPPAAQAPANREAPAPVAAAKPSAPSAQQLGKELADRGRSGFFTLLVVAGLVVVAGAYNVSRGTRLYYTQGIKETHKSAEASDNSVEVSTRTEDREYDPEKGLHYESRLGWYFLGWILAVAGCLWALSLLLHFRKAMILSGIANLEAEIAQKERSVKDFESRKEPSLEKIGHKAAEGAWADSRDDIAQERQEVRGLLGQLNEVEQKRAASVTDDAARAELKRTLSGKIRAGTIRLGSRVVSVGFSEASIAAELKELSDLDAQKRALLEEIESLKSKLASGKSSYPKAG